MGRHSSGSGWHFYKSVVAWFFPWLAFAAVIGVAVWIAVDTLGGDGDVPAAVSTSPQAEASRTPSPTPSKSTRPKPSPKPKKSPTPKQSPTPDVALVTEGISIQVLNGSGEAGADETMAGKLERLGFQIVSVQEASKGYPKTTVFWSFPSAKKAARPLAERFGWVAKPKPENLSATVDIHVVVGADEGN